MRIFLLPFSLVYYLIAALRNFFYDKGLFRPRGIGARVISVGNITWGGTGKTPAVIFIANSLLRNKKQPAILTRGYGNDEKTLLTDSTRGIPVITGSDRLKTGRDALNRYSLDTILLDDAFQHRRVKRDLDIVCIDATDPFGNRMVIPAGSMREGIGGLRRADIFLLTRADLVKDPIAVKKLEIKLKDINPRALIVKSVHKPKSCYKLSDEQLIDMGMLRDKGIALVSAIGNPSSFEKTILNLGLKFKRHFVFRDHHWYTEKELKKIKDYCVENNIDTVVTTEKDAVRLKAFSCQLSAVSFLVLRVELQITENEQAFHDRLFGIYNS